MLVIILTVWGVTCYVAASNEHIKIALFLFMYVCIFVSVCLVFVDAHRGQKRVSDLLELELQAVVNSPLWVLGTELWSSARAANVLDLWVISPVLSTCS